MSERDERRPTRLSSYHCLVLIPRSNTRSWSRSRKAAILYFLLCSRKIIGLKRLRKRRYDNANHLATSRLRYLVRSSSSRTNCLLSHHHVFTMRWLRTQCHACVRACVRAFPCTSLGSQVFSVFGFYFFASSALVAC